MANSHEILFCTDDEAALAGLAHFIGAALEQGNPAIVWATASHRDALVQRFRDRGIDIDGAIEQGTYIASDVAEVPDPEHILMTLRGLWEAACRAGKKDPRVAVCGERAGRFWADGQTDAAIRIEQLFNELAKVHEMDVLCIYPLASLAESRPAFATLCAEHTLMSFRWTGSVDKG